MQKVSRILLLLVVGAIFMIAIGCSNQKSNQNEQSKQIEIRNKQNEQALIGIRDAAEKGKLPNQQWQVGKSTFQQIQDQIGGADNVERDSKGTHVVYEKEQLKLRLTENNQVYKLRTVESTLDNVTQTQTKEILGAPDKLRQVDEQTAFIYELNDEYRLTLLFTSSENHASIAEIAVLHKPSAEIQAVIEGMQLDEKLGQMIMMGVQGPQLDSVAKTFIQDRHVGGIILFKRNFVSVSQSLNLINELKQANANSKTPLFIGADEEGGRVTRLPKGLMKTPSNRKVGNAANGKYAYDVGELIGRKMSAFGLNMDFAPVLDVDSNSNNPVIGDRSYGNDAQLVSKAGIQQANGMTSEYVIPVVKHFPGHGDTSVDSHIDLPVITHNKERLQNVELLPFKQAIKGGVNAVMVGHLLVEAYDPKTPASFSKIIIQDLLRDELQFDGVVITDDLVMGAIVENYSIGEVGVQSIVAGGDILLVGHKYTPVNELLTALQEAINEGVITEQRINQSVERILLMKQQYEVKDIQREQVNVEELNQQTKELIKKIESGN
ncbi:beta-N-acetylhexosaminidase [Sporosarcina sp. P20a]|uniref:beta-N-acetylhexosaminidase n=1 Tax=Sporosarcina sp. P20a TaxID=2048256 RepID=UPI000C167B2F|nr:beta-N-acetylhexosaminidase [Sporosarcina sp. P20a]PIC85780.1 beta-N-acetylhexosaminidase [Sporosarcina sp. P20a]